MAFQPDLHAKAAHKNMIEKLQQDNQNYHVHTWKQLFCCQFKWLKTASINWCQTIMKPAISSTCPHSVELCVPLRDHFLIGSSHGTSRQSQPTRYHRPNHKILQRDTINRPGISSVLQRKLTGTKALEFKNIILKKKYGISTGTLAHRKSLLTLPQISAMVAWLRCIEWPILSQIYGL